MIILMYNILLQLKVFGNSYKYNVCFNFDLKFCISLYESLLTTTLEANKLYVVVMPGYIHMHRLGMSLIGNGNQWGHILHSCLSMLTPQWSFSWHAGCRQYCAMLPPHVGLPTCPHQAFKLHHYNTCHFI